MKKNALSQPAEMVQRWMAVEPVLAVRNVGAATRYYREVLGFEDVWLWDDPPTHGGANRDGLQIQFTLNPALAEAATGQRIYIRVQDVAALYAQHQERGAEIIEVLQPRPYGLSAYTLRDLNGYLLDIAGDEMPASSQALPSRVGIDARLPTRIELEALIRAVGWEDAANLAITLRVLDAAQFGVVAVVDREVVGCALVTSDNAGFYYVRDVIVQPDWQGKHIGAALMQSLMDLLRANVPAGSLIGLFTGAKLHHFYARFGFHGPNSGPYGMTQVI